MAGILYVVATPIGNLEDVTLRALRILQSVDRVACEDTRRTRQLLSHYQIHKPLESYHEHNERTKSSQLLERLKAGQSIALVTDGGTPTISDPGYHLVRRCADEGILVIPLPGAVAAITALSASGLATHAFVFLGFPPSKAAAQRNLLERVKPYPYTLLFYESPRRILRFLRTAAETLGDREAIVARELTKVYETFYRGRLLSLAAALESAGPLRGEVTLVIAGAASEPPVEKGPAAISMAQHLAEVMAQTGLTKNEAMKIVAQERHLTRRQVYAALISHKQE